MPGLLNSHAQVTRIIFRIANGLVTFQIFLAKARDGRARIDDAPLVRIIARGDFHPVDEIGLRRLYAETIVKSRVFAQVQNNLRELAGHEAVLTKRGGNSYGLRWRGNLREIGRAHV